MPDRESRIARVRLSRSLPRLLALPVTAFLVGTGLVVAGLLLATGTARLVVGGAGSVLALLALVVAAVLLSIRLDVEEAAVRVRWLGGERVYSFSRGPITRVRLRGDDASRLRASRIRLRLGWQFGPAVLREEERIEVVRLAPTPTAILIPTERGRLAIAAADEASLLDALARAAHARQRMDELTAQEASTQESQAAEPEVAEAQDSQARLEVAPSLMTGIERAVYEQRQAEERAIATAAEAERLELEAAAPAADELTEPAAEPEPPAIPKRSRLNRLRQPLPTAWIRRPAGSMGATGPSIALLLLPLVGAGAAWGLGLLLDRMPTPESDLGRLTALALVLAGPATTVGAIMARVWWPRLVGVVVVGGLAGSVFVGRALVGG